MRKYIGATVFIVLLIVMCWALTPTSPYPLGKWKNPEFKTYYASILELTKNISLGIIVTDYTRKDIPDEWHFAYQIRAEF